MDDVQKHNNCNDEDDELSNDWKSEEWIRKDVEGSGYEII
jgi:hypothetical protein